MWARHRALLLRREVPVVPAPVLAQSWRGAPRQVLLARLLAGCDVEALDDTGAKATGALAARAGNVEGALRRHDLVITSDPRDLRDLRAIAAAAGRHLQTDQP